MSKQLQQIVSSCRDAVVGGRHRRGLTRWHLVPAAAALSLLILACTDRSENPVAPLSSPSATPVFGQSTVDNGTGACLTEDTENAGYINNVGDLNCTSQDLDIAIASASTYSTESATTGFVTLASTGGKIQCEAGDTVWVNTSAQIQNHANERYDVGLWIGELGGSAKDGTSCLHFNLVEGLNGSQDLDLQTNDSCGDVAQNTNVDVPLGTLKLLCVDGNPAPDSSAIVISACAGWLNSESPGNRDGICPVNPPGGALGFRYGTTPETTAKCKCEPLSLPLDIRGSITIIKNTVGGNATFAFTHDVGTNSDPTVSTPFNITTVANTGQQVFEKVAEGTYHITESAPPSGWTFTSLICSAGGSVSAQTATITLAAGANVTCTFTNTQNGSITIVKDAIPNDPQDFAFAGNITGCTAFSLDDDADATLSNTKVCAVAPGTFNVDETVPSGWVKTSAVCSDGSPITAIEVSPGENITCTFTNTKNGTITVVKDVQNPASDPQDFAFAGNITACTAFSLDDDADATLSNSKNCSVVPGTYNVDETVPTGWEKTSATCSDGSPITAIEVSPGENITCTFVNQRLPNLTVKKIVIGAGTTFDFTGTGTGVDASFTITPATDNFATKVFSSIPIGTKTVTEIDEAGYVLTDLSCDKGSTIYDPTVIPHTVSVDLAYGDNVTCTFINEIHVGETTRTQGFWATHSSITNVAWFGGTFAGNTFAGVDQTLCGKTLDTLPKVLGGFWSNISQTTTKTKRSSLDQARMRLLQQLLAAELNQSAFGSSPSTITFAAAEAAYCGTDITAINNAQSLLGAFNEGGDSGDFTPGASANGKLAKTLADLVFWNVLP